MSVNSRTTKPPSPQPGINSSFVPDEVTKLLQAAQGDEEDDEYDFGLTAEELAEEVEASLENHPAPPDRTWAEWFIFMKPALLIVFWYLCKNISLTLIQPQVPFLLKHYYNGDEGQAAQTQTIFDATRALLAAFLVPVYGNLLDSVGRRPFFIFGGIASALPPAFLYALPRNPLWYLFFYEVSLLFSTTYSLAYISDCYEERDRAKVFAIADGVQAMGALIAIAAQHMSPDAIVALALIVAMLRVPFSLFVIPETLPKHQRKKFELSLLTPNPLKSMRVITTNKVMKAVTVIICCVLVAAVGIADITSYFLQERVSWHKDDAFTQTVENGLLQPVALLIVYPIVSRFVRLERIVLFAFLCLDGALVVLILLFAKWEVFALLNPLGITSVLAIPALVGIFANAGKQDNQGMRMAGVAALMDLTNAFVPLIMGVMFAHLPKAINWIPFLICLLATTPAIVIAGCFLTRWIREDRAMVLAESFVKSGNTSFGMPGPKPLAVAAVEEAEAKSGRPRANSRADGSLPGSRTRRGRANSQAASSLPGSRNNRV